MATIQTSCYDWARSSVVDPGGVDPDPDSVKIKFGSGWS